ncbi:MAG: hypothetical protein ACR2OU_03855, partial [Thermomicrobiales bacterium]
MNKARKTVSLSLSLGLLIAFLVNGVLFQPNTAYGSSLTDTNAEYPYKVTCKNVSENSSVPRRVLGGDNLIGDCQTTYPQAKAGLQAGTLTCIADPNAFPFQGTTYFICKDGFSSSNRTATVKDIHAEYPYKVTCKNVYQDTSKSSRPLGGDNLSGDCEASDYQSKAALK